MTPSLTVAFVWFVTANVIAIFPSKHAHWPAAYALIATGLPLLVLVFRENGVWVGLVVLAMACSVLRWPVRYLLRWLRSLVEREAVE